MNQVLVKCLDLDFTIGYKRIFKKLNFQLRESESRLLLGENGAGKSTLLKLIYHGTHIGFQFPRPIRMSYVGHSLGLYSSLSLKENLLYFAKIAKSTHLDKLEHWLDLFELKKRFLDPVHTFSEGMKKKSSLIRSLLTGGELWLLDEPFNGLDSKSSEHLKDIIKNFQGSILLATHDPLSVQGLVQGEWKLTEGKILVRDYVDSPT
jgi:heme exporter protein A